MSSISAEKLGRTWTAPDVRPVEDELAGTAAIQKARAAVLATLNGVSERAEETAREARVAVWTTRDLVKAASGRGRQIGSDD